MQARQPAGTTATLSLHFSAEAQDHLITRLGEQMNAEYTIPDEITQLHRDVKAIEAHNKPLEEMLEKAESTSSTANEVLKRILVTMKQDPSKKAQIDNDMISYSKLVTIQKGNLRTLNEFTPHAYNAALSKCVAISATYNSNSKSAQYLRTIQELISTNQSVLDLHLSRRDFIIGNDNTASAYNRICSEYQRFFGETFSPNTSYSKNPNSNWSNKKDPMINDAAAHCLQKKSKCVLL